MKVLLAGPDHEGERTLVEIADAMPHLKERLPQIPGVAYRDGQKVCFTSQRPMLDDLHRELWKTVWKAWRLDGEASNHYLA